MILRTSSSIVCAVSSDTLLVCVTDLPRKTSLLSSAYARGPSLVDRPHFVTMLRAIPVARPMSLLAQVVTFSGQQITSSAIPPPNRQHIAEFRRSEERRLGKVCASPGTYR